MHACLTHRLCWAILIVACVAEGGPGLCRGQGPCNGRRQCYPGGWIRRDDGGYSRRYYFKPSLRDTKYQMHYVIYYPGDDWMYYYNPERRTYWCRASRDVSAKDGKIWVVLPRESVRGRLADIPAEAWDRPREVPLIPGCDKTGDRADLAAMLPPPPPPR
jgi:hypothetical protein